MPIVALVVGVYLVLVMIPRPLVVVAVVVAPNDPDWHEDLSNHRV